MRSFLSVNPQWQKVKVLKAGHYSYSESTFDWLQTPVWWVESEYAIKNPAVTQGDTLVGPKDESIRKTV